MLQKHGGIRRDATTDYAVVTSIESGVLNLLPPLCELILPHRVASCGRCGSEPPELGLHSLEIDDGVVAVLERTGVDHQ